MGWVMDFGAQALRNIIIGLGGKMDGSLMQSEFGSPWPRSHGHPGHGV